MERERGGEGRGEKARVRGGGEKQGGRGGKRKAQERKEMGGRRRE